MRPARLEAFSDGVLAILITVMVLQLRNPVSGSWRALGEDLPALFAYLLSFVHLAIYWNNHHHLLATASRVGGGVLWANLHLLFWLSLVPFTTSWMSETGFTTVPTAIYGLVLLLASFGYFLLQLSLLDAQQTDTRLRSAVGRNVKGKISPLLYCLGIALSFVDPRLGLGIYVIIALFWLIPDRRYEREIALSAEGSKASRQA